MNTITLIIKKKRKENEITQVEMANKLHLSLRAYQKVEKGTTKLDVERLTQIAKILGMPASDLISAQSDSDILLSSKKGRVSNKEPVLQSEGSNLATRLLQVIIDAKGKELNYLQEASRQGAI